MKAEINDPLCPKRWTVKKKKAVVPVMLAGILLCASSVGLGMAFTGVFTDTNGGGDIPVMEVNVNSEKGIEFDATKLDNIILDSFSVKANNTVWALSKDNTKWTVSADQQTATKTVGFITLKLKGNANLTGNLNVNLTKVDAIADNCVDIKMKTGTPTTFQLDANGEQTIVLEMTITITAPAYAGTIEGAPAFGWTTADNTAPVFTVDKFKLVVTATDKAVE